MNTNGIVSQSVLELKTAKGVIENLTQVVLGGNTHFYICLKNDENYYDVDLSDPELIEAIRYKEGDSITLQYEEGYGIHSVKKIGK